MAPKHPSLSSPGTPAFLARMMSIPAVNDAIILATHIYDNTKQESNEYVRAAFLAAEEGMRAAATGALPLATPIVERVGGWEAVDDWACRGIDRVAKAAPIITKPTEEIVNTTREKMLMAVAGTNSVPTSFSAAISARATNTVGIVSNFSTRKTATNLAERILGGANILVDQYLPARPGDPRETGVDSGTLGSRASSLLTKTRKRLFRSVHNVAYPHLKNTVQSTEGSFSLTLLADFGRSAVSTMYDEVRRQPREGEPASLPLRLARSAYQTNLRVAQRLGPDFQRSVTNVQTAVRSRDVAGAARGMLDANRVVLSSAWTWGTDFIDSGRTWVEDKLRQAMAAYEARERRSAKTTRSQQRVQTWQPTDEGQRRRRAN